MTATETAQTRCLAASLFRVAGRSSEVGSAELGEAQPDMTADRIDASSQIEIRWAKGLQRPVCVYMWISE